MAAEIEQYITYQHNVQRYFREHAEKYSGVIIPLSIATSFPTGTYGFVRALCSKHKHRYAIDPRTAMFQKDWNRANVRPPHKKMAQVLGGPFLERGLSGPLGADDFADVATCQAVTKSCLDFQMNFKAREEDVRKLNKYKKLLGIADLDELGNPQFVIPPYFLFGSPDDEWYTVNKRCIEYGLEIADDMHVSPVIHVSTWPDEDSWDSILGDLKKMEVESCWLYPDDYREHDRDEASLMRYASIVQACGDKGVEVHVLFGGYYSILMHYFGLSGFGNGIGYGEWRNSGYHRGGTAIIRLYMPKLHRYLDTPRAQYLIDEDPEYFASDSELLAECVKAERPLTEITLAESLDHFMECRFREMQFVSENPPEVALQELNDTYDHLKDIGPLEAEKYGESLRRWGDVLAELETAT